ncbi:MAG TPA: hypothetical protein V6D28_14865 [Leptolyngbyaceae cyanobacterium]
MTFQTDRIQALIAEIDEALNSTRKSRLGWLKLGEVGQQRQLLEKLRSNLQNLQEQLATTAQRSLLIDRIASLPIEPVDLVEPLASEQNQQNTPPEILQAVVQEMSYLRHFYEQATFLNLRQQYQADLEVLQQKRQALLDEIQQLQQQRKLYAASFEAEKQLPNRESERSSLETSSQIPEPKNIVSDEEHPSVTSSQVTSPDSLTAVTNLEIPLLYAGAELPPQIAFLNEQDSEKILENQESEGQENLGVDDETAASNLTFEDESEMSPSKSPIEDTSNFSVNEIEDVVIPDTIASLTDLLEIISASDELANESLPADTQLERAEGATVTEELVPTTDASVGEVTESFIPASVDEDLLPAAERQNNSNVDLWLGKNMLDRLSEDLSSLEGINLTEVSETNDILLQNNDLAVQSSESDRESALNQEDLVVNRDLEETAMTGGTEIPCTIPEDILAEFDDLFGESAEKMTPTSIWEEDQALEKKN